MIRRNSNKIIVNTERLKESSFTGTAGIDVTSPPTQRETVFELTNLDVNLDGSLTLRNPLIYHQDSPNSLIYTYIFNNKLLILDETHHLYIKDGAVAIPIYYSDTTIDNYFLSNQGIDLSKCEITNTGTSTILSNVLVDLKLFEGGKYYKKTIGNAYDTNESFITSTYFKLEYSNDKYILKYINPDIANLNSSETIALNPNTATYYTFAVRDNYKASVTSIEGILAYTSNDYFNSETVAELTESTKHSIIESVPNDFTGSIILKAFMNIAYMQSSKYYILWERTYDNITWSEIPEFYNNFETVTLKIKDDSKINESLENVSENYIYRRACRLETPNLEEDLLILRPDVLKLNTLDRATYRCSIYVTYDKKTTYLNKEVQVLENTDSSKFKNDGSIVRFFKDKANADTSFTFKYFVDDINNFLPSSFSAKMVRGTDIINVTLNVTTGKELDSSGLLLGQYITISAQNPHTENFSKLQYDVRTAAIFIYYDNIFFDVVRYSFTAYEYTYFNTHNLDSSNFIQVPIIAYCDGFTSKSEIIFNINYKEMFSYDEIEANLNEMQAPHYAVPLSNFSSSTITYANPRTFFSVEEISEYVSTNPDLAPDYRDKSIIIYYTDYLGNSREKRYSYPSEFWEAYDSAVTNNKSHFYYDESMNYVDEFTVAGIYRNDTVYANYDIAAYLILTSKFEIFKSDIPYWIASNTNYIKSLETTTPTVNIKDPTGSETEGTLDDSYLISVKQWSSSISDSINIVQIDISNTSKGKKLYYKNKIYTYGVEDFKNNIFVSDSDSFITPLYNVIDLNMTSESMVTTLIPWRDYLIAASESSIYLIQNSGDGTTSKAINTYIGIPSKDSNTCKAILNGIVFKSGLKIYSLQPSMYSSDDTILNIVDISKPIANYIKDSTYDNFAFTTERAYYLFMPKDNSTTCLKYEYARKIWTKYEYPVRLYKYHIKSVDDIYVFSDSTIYYFEKDMDWFKENIHSDVVQYGDYLTHDMQCTPITFSLDSGQKTDNLSSTKQFVESKFILATLSNDDTFPLDVDIYIDGLYFKNTHIDANTDASFWKNSLQDLGSLSTSFINNTADSFNVLRQMFMRYSGKGKTIRHVISGKSNFNFKIYVLYYRYKLTHNKQ